MKVLIYVGLILSIAIAQDSHSALADTAETGHHDRFETDTTFSDRRVMVNEDSSGVDDVVKPTFALLSLLDEESLSQADLKIDSILSAEILNFSLANLSEIPKMNVVRLEKSQLCLQDTCLDQLSLESDVSHLLVWSLVREETAKQLVLSVYELHASHNRLTKTYHISDEENRAIQDIRKAAWSIFEKMPPPGLFEDRLLNKWVCWVKVQKNKYYIGSVVATAVMAWIILQYDDEEPFVPGIGDPPDWP